MNDDLKKNKENLAPIHSFARRFNYIRKTPFELLDEKGYNLFECKSEEDMV